MSKTIVSIISAQPTPNYLLIRELFLPGDGLLFITSTKMQTNIDHLVNTLSCNVPITRVILPEGVEERWDEMCVAITKQLDPDKEYAVNLTGGTKYMALAVQNVFEKYNSVFYYIPFPRNVMLCGSREIPITTRVSVEEFMLMHGHKIKSGNPIRDFKSAARFLDLFTSGKLGGEDFEAIDKLREYRNSDVSIKFVEQKEDQEKKPAIPNLSALLNKIGFTPVKEEQLSKYESQYLTGGWFEEYVYFLVKKEIGPDDIRFGVKLNETNNDLDVVYTKSNKLFVIECKTDIERQSMLNSIAYKASALKDYLKGISAHSYIFALAKDDDKWTKISTNMGIVYFGRDHFTDKEKCKQMILSLKAKE